MNKKLSEKMNAEIMSVTENVIEKLFKTYVNHMFYDETKGSLSFDTLAFIERQPTKFIEMIEKEPQSERLKQANIDWSQRIISRFLLEKIGTQHQLTLVDKEASITYVTEPVKKERIQVMKNMMTLNREIYLQAMLILVQNRFILCPSFYIGFYIN